MSNGIAGFPHASGHPQLLDGDSTISVGKILGTSAFQRGTQCSLLATWFASLSAGLRRSSGVPNRHLEPCGFAPSDTETPGVSGQYPEDYQGQTATRKPPKMKRAEVCKTIVFHEISTLSGPFLTGILTY